MLVEPHKCTESKESTLEEDPLASLATQPRKSSLGVGQTEVWQLAVNCCPQQLGLQHWLQVSVAPFHEARDRIQPLHSLAERMQQDRQSKLGQRGANRWVGRQTNPWHARRSASACASSWASRRSATTESYRGASRRVRVHTRTAPLGSRCSYRGKGCSRLSLALQATPTFSHAVVLPQGLALTATLVPAHCAPSPWFRTKLGPRALGGDAQEARSRGERAPRRLRV